MFTGLMLMMGIASASAAQAWERSFGAPDTVVVRSGSLTLRGLLWRPDGPGPFPAVLYNHGSGPQSDLTRPAKLGPAFAGHGFVVLYLFRRGAGLWEASPKLRDRLLAAVRRTTTPVFFVHAANDYSVSAGQALDAEMARAGRSHALKLYPAVGSTPKEGHDIIHQQISTWRPDVLAFLDRYVRR